MKFVWSPPFGAELRANGSAHFRLWAPDLQSADLEIEFAHSTSAKHTISMQRTPNGWFECNAKVAAGARYRYRINEELAVADPASRLQSGGVHGWSVVCDPLEFDWQHDKWRGRPWHEIIIYELHVGCCGGFAGVERKLYELAALGITAVELMPIAAFAGERNWGYDGVLPYAPAEAYGSPTQLKQLIDTAHGLGLCVYLDVVYNHFGPEGNYLGCYASAFFDPNKHSPWGAAIDFSQKPVRDFFTHNAIYWLQEYRFDGLRIDAAHAITDPDWLDEMATSVRANCGADRHIHLMLENERNDVRHLRLLSDNAVSLNTPPHLYNAQWNDDWHNAIHVLLTNEREGYYANYINANEVIQQPVQALVRSLAEGFAYQGEPSPTHAHQPRGTPSADLPPTAFINFLQNHDQIGNRACGERLTALIAAEDLRAATLLLLLAPAIPLIFMGEEIGSRTPFLYFTDFTGDFADAVREGRRAEFSAFAAFRDAEQRACIPDPNAKSTFENSIPQATDSSAAHDTRNFYRHLLQLRREHIVPRLASTKISFAKTLAAKAIAARWHLDGVRFNSGRQNDSGCQNESGVLEIAANFGNDEVAYTLPPAPLLFEYPPRSYARARAGRLLPHCAIVTLQVPS